MSSVKLESNVTDFTGQIKKASGIDLRKCYQCGKCSAGCPMVFQMSAGGGSALGGDYPPNKLIRDIQLGQRETVLKSDTIWVCVSCITCSTRCPKEVDIAGLMDVCRELSIKEGLATKAQKKIQAFHKSFLENIKSHGRLYEFMLIAKYKMRTMELFQDVFKAPKMLMAGKMHLLPHGVENKDAVKRIFENCYK